MSEHYSFPLLERENIEVTVELLLSASSGRPKAPALRIHLKAVAKTTSRFGNFVICRPDKAFVTKGLGTFIGVVKLWKSCLFLVLPVLQMNSKADYNPMPTEIDDNMFLRCNISHLWLEIAIV